MLLTPIPYTGNIYSTTIYNIYTPDHCYIHSTLLSTLLSTPQITAETGQEVGFHRPGSLRLGTSAARMDEFRYTLSRQLHKQSPMQLLGPEQVAELVPILNMDNIHGGLFTPNEGHIDPYRCPDNYLHISTLPPQPHHGHRARRPGPGRGARAELRRERAAAARGRRLGRGDGARHGAGQPGHQLRRGVLSCFPPIINLYPSQWLKQ